MAFEKTHGDKSGIEDVIVSKRRFQYEEVNVPYHWFSLKRVGN